VLVSLSEGVGERKKMLANEKHWKNPSTYEYDIVHCTASCWILGENVDRKWLNNVGERVNLIKAQYIHTWKAKPPWDYQYTLNFLKMKSRMEK
jgi:hypothetical protein